MLKALEQKISDVAMAEVLVEDKMKKVAVARSFLDITAMTDEAWDQFVKDVVVYPGAFVKLFENSIFVLVNTIHNV